MVKTCLTITSHSYVISFRLLLYNCKEFNKINYKSSFTKSNLRFQLLYDIFSRIVKIYSISSIFPSLTELINYLFSPGRKSGCIVIIISVYSVN